MKRNEKKPQAPEPRAKRISIILYIGVTLSFIVPIIFIVLMMVFGKGSMSDAGYHSKADYALMIVQCVLGLISINLPSLLAKRFKFEIPVVLYALFTIFLYCAIFLGEVRSFYYVIPYWDSILHCFSSLMLGFFGLPSSLFALQSLSDRCGRYTSSPLTVCSGSTCRSSCSQTARCSSGARRCAIR